MIRRGARRFGGGALLTGLFIGFGMWWSNGTTLAAARAASPTLVSASRPIDAAPARALADTLRAAIVKAPLDQDLVNRFYTLASVNRLVDASEREAWLRLMARLGWRSTAAQQNLIGAAAAADDLSIILDRTDAMLRRARFVGELVVLLYAVEQVPETREDLVARLERGVSWRQTFFGDPRGVASAAGRQARLATVDRMFADGHALSRDEIAPLLSAMTAVGDDAGAYRVWSRFRRQFGGRKHISEGVTFDPDFASYAASHAGGATADLPFEWQPASGDAASADIVREGVTLHWDGNGVPVLLRQKFRAAPGWYELTLAGTEATPDLLNRLDFVAACAGGDVRFTRIRRDRAGGLIVGSETPIACAFPTLLVRGRASLAPQPVDAALSSLALRPVRG